MLVGRINERMMAVRDYSKLKGKITEVFGTQVTFSNAMELSERSISLKLNEKIDFSQREIEKAVSVLGLKKDDIPEYFFKNKE